MRGAVVGCSSLRLPWGTCLARVHLFNEHTSSRHMALPQNSLSRSASYVVHMSAMPCWAARVCPAVFKETAELRARHAESNRSTTCCCVTRACVCRWE